MNKDQKAVKNPPSIRTDAEVFMVFDRCDVTDCCLCETISATEDAVLNLLQQGVNYDDVAIIKGKYLDFVPKIVG